ncbi:MAG TPA: type I restriction enzyme HsdR N-terminal domain-containing protein [Sedimentibacter sp.]|nr:type I restriction enzyme HsdR N-terminal domain-containing protein [Sedimentibacter sp.]
MSEYEIAVNKVIPYIKKKFKWPDSLISQYGRVPVQSGSNTVWADVVCYINYNQKPQPWLLIEVKKEGIPLEQAIPQAESYSILIGCPFFCITDGVDYNYFITGKNQGRSISLYETIPVPSKEYLMAGVSFITFPMIVDNLVELFILGLKSEARFYKDTEEHANNTIELKKFLFDKVDTATPEELKHAIDKYIMVRTPNKLHLYSAIDNDINRVRKVLRFIKSFSGDPVFAIDQLLDKASELYLKGAGIFVITQLLAGAHPDEYIALEENISKSLQFLGITDILVKNDTANGYVYVNDICKKLYEDKFKNKVEDFGLVAVHNFLWHYYVYYRKHNKWYV